MNIFDGIFKAPEDKTEEEIRSEALRAQTLAASVQTIDPVEASHNIKKDYGRYLKTILHPRMPQVEKSLSEAIDNATNLDVGPILQLTSAYEQGKSARELIDEHVLAAGFSDIGPSFPLDRPLYKHQEKALRKATAGHNIIVSTGTGSGKTESFLLPIINELVRQRDAGELGPGVRALLLYPMNALANDQVKRLRELLAPLPDITFGRYTGETEQSEKAALEKFRRMEGPGVERLPNELVSRDEIQKTPPHILLTNYAMLEYLLLRPRDTSLFDGEYADDWRFIVIDEAHVYAGAQGSEVAMLIRRLKDRVAANKRIQCIATSASLEGGDERVTEFGTKLFGEPFETENLVYANKIEYPQSATWEFPVDVLDKKYDSGELTEYLDAQTGTPFDALNEEKHVVELRALLTKKSRPLAEIATKMWPDVPQKLAMQRVHKVVLLASSVTSEQTDRTAAGTPVFSARYHMFIRATEGAFISFDDGLKPVVQLERQRERNNRRVYEMGTCIRCGAVHILANTDEGDGIVYPTESTRLDQKARWVLLNPDDKDTFEDEDETLFSDYSGTEGEVSPILKFCTHCGKLHQPIDDECTNPRCSSTDLMPIRVLPKEKGTVRCLVCGGRSENQIRRLLTDGNATPAVLTTSLFQLLPPSQEHLAGGGRKLLTFSDSRQRAAAAAPYLEETYRQLLERRILVEALEDRTLTFDEVVENATAIAYKHNIFKKTADQEIPTALYADLVSVSTRLSLEGLALAKVEVDPERIKELPVFQPMAEALSEETVRDFFNVLLQEMRRGGALIIPKGVKLNDERLSPRNGQFTIRLDGGADRKKQVFSWLPAEGRTNNREMFFKKFLTHVNGEEPDKKSITTMMTQIFEMLEEKMIITPPTLSSAGLAVDRNTLRFHCGDHVTWYECDTCRQVTAFNVLDLCPNGWCDGHLKQLDHVPNNHYRDLARNMKFVPLTAQEHTAQWSAQEAASIQKNFINGIVNVLSCSTTFELGVDVGDLQSVVMRNVPPRTANYVQRAGRAGRRAGSAAFVLTYANRRSHDFSIFDDPISMIDGEMPAPFITVDNVRIDQRHLYSVAFAAFLRHQANRGVEWNTIGDFFKQDGLTALREFVNDLPAEITDAALRIFPEEMHEEMHIKDRRWIKSYKHLWDDVYESYNSDHSMLTAMEEEAVAKRDFGQAKAVKYSLNTLERQNLLSYLPKVNLLPKYGFPVDTVELNTSFTNQGKMLDLSRDLQLAISEFAPGATIVAGGYVWESGGLRLLPERALKTYYWKQCPNCDNVETSLKPLDDHSHCSLCGTGLEPPATDKQEKMVVPEFGFYAKDTNRRAGTTTLSNRWNRVEFVKKFGQAVDERVFEKDGKEVHIASWNRTEMGVMERGPERAFIEGSYSPGGFYYCTWCGFATRDRTRPRKHNNPRNEHPCTGSLERISLGHIFQTDIATVSVTHQHATEMAGWRSALYALIEASSELLEINRDDINGTITYWNGGPSMVLYDTVPGGAGISKKIIENFPAVVQAALKRVSNCDCGVETSCYSCLRSYQNQRYHEQLSRGRAIELLSAISALV